MLSPLRRSVHALFAFALVASACGDDKVPPGGSPKDGGVTGDTGTHVNPDANQVGQDANQVGQDANQVGQDANQVGQDAAVQACNAVTGSGCAAGNCVFNPTSLAAVCVNTAAGTKTYNQACDTNTQDCVSGNTCLSPGGAAATCQKMCNGDPDCAGLPAAPNGYGCIELPGGSGLGLCIEKPTTCEPLNDTCPANQYCEIGQGGAGGCFPEGTHNPGDACTPQDACKKGANCMDFGDGAKCYEHCSTTGASGCANAGDTCIGVTGLSFGICQAGCDMLDVNTCSADKVCAPVSQTAFACTTAPNPARPVGGPCSTQNLCDRGAICVPAPQTGTPTCYQVCRPGGGTPACTTGTCQQLQGVTFGVCA